MKKFFCILCILIAVFPLFAGRYVLPVFETSDIHGYIADTSTGNSSSYQYRLAWIADKVNDKRGDDPDSVVLIDAGDIYQGNAISNLQEGLPLSKAYAVMGYDAVAIGNHEFDWGIESTVDADKTMVGESKVPVVCSDMYLNGETVPFAYDYVIVSKNAYGSDGSFITVNVGIIGYTFDYSSSIMLSKFSGAGYSVVPDVSALEKLAGTLKREKDCAVVIVLTHEEPTSLASSLSSHSSVDLVCGGHTHKNTFGTVHSIGYMEPASQATAYAYAELVISTNANGKVSDTAVSQIHTVSVTGSKRELYDNQSNRDNLDSDVLAISKKAIADSEEALNSVLGYVVKSIDKNSIGGNPMSSTAGNWLTGLMCRATDSDVGFTNNGGIRTSFSTQNGKRNITPGDIYTIIPFCNAIYVYEITFSELLGVLDYTINAGKGFALRMSGIDCYYSGTTVNALVYNGTVIYKNGRWTSGWKDKTVRIAVNEYVATATDTPFAQWNNTARLVDSSVIDNESAIAVLKEEAAKSGGLLNVDTAAHLIKGTLR